MKARGYKDSDIPYISDVGAYSKAWISWWRACQPSWRQTQEWPLPKEAPIGARWEKLAARGQNGMFIVVMSTTWWAIAIESPDHYRVFDEAVDDVRWVIEQVLNSSSGVTNTSQVPSPEPSSTDTAPGATWMKRGDGKRRSKPSRVLLESMGS